MDAENKALSKPGGKSWLEDTLRPFNFMHAIRERQQVRACCTRCLELYRQVSASLPDSTPRQRYEFVVSEYTGGDAVTVRRVIRRAEESFAAWPVERDLIFRDIVQYLAATECLEDNASDSGIRTRVGAVVCDLISENL